MVILLNEEAKNVSYLQCFEPYWKKEDVQAGLKRGQLVEVKFDIDISLQASQKM